MTVTARLALPLIVPGQAQKEMTHNEALAAIDLAMQASVVAAGVDSPPLDPELGACWIVGPAPIGAWAGRPRAIAGWTDGGWRFVSAREGMTAWISGDETMVRYSGGAWTLAAPAAPVAAIAPPVGGATIDTQARAALAAILAVLEQHGLMDAPDM